MNGNRSTTTGTSDATVPMLVDRRVAAKLLGISPSSVDNLRTSGQLASLKIAARRLYDVADLRRLIDARKAVQS